MREVKIGNKVITKGNLTDTYIIAEAGVNHECSIYNAKCMIENASKAGADAIKFQAYKADTLASRCSPSYWDLDKEAMKNQFELFKKYDHFSKDDFIELADYAKYYNIDFIATPFDQNSVDFLYELVPVYKIASADITNMPLMKYIASKGKTILLSTGASTVSEIFQAIEWIESENNPSIILLHCILNYPTQYCNANLGMIRDMVNMFDDYIIGYSDHTIPEYSQDLLIYSWLLGAQVIEKHFTLNKSSPGNDHYHAFDFSDLSLFIEKLRVAKKAIGNLRKNYIPSEELSRNYARRSLVAAKEILQGDTIKLSDISCKRPGTGIPPWMINQVIGGIALEYIQEDEILTFNKIRLIDNH